MLAWILSISCLPLSVPQQRRRNPQEGVYNVSIGEFTVHPGEMEEGCSFSLGQARPSLDGHVPPVGSFRTSLKLGRVPAPHLPHLFLAVLWALRLWLGNWTEAVGYTGQRCGAGLSERMLTPRAGVF